MEKDTKKQNFYFQNPYKLPKQTNDIHSLTTFAQNDPHLERRIF